jgi:hypothetical protein
MNFFKSFFQFIYLSEKTQNKKVFQISENGHSENVHFWKSASTFFSEKTQNSTSEHNAVKTEIL